LPLFFFFLFLCLLLELVQQLKDPPLLVLNEGTGSLLVQVDVHGEVSHVCWVNVDFVGFTEPFQVFLHGQRPIHLVEQVRRVLTVQIQ